MDTDPTDKAAFGYRLRQRRERAGMSRPVFGGLVGRSAEWVKAVEAGRLAMPRLDMLLRIAEVLGISDLADLTGDRSSRIDRFMRGQHPAALSIRTAVQRYALTQPQEVSGASVPALRDRVDAAWRAWHRP